MRQKKAFSVFTTGMIFGFILGFVYIFGQLRHSLGYIKSHKYIEFRLTRLVVYSLQDSIYVWIKITIMTALILLAVWLAWKLIFVPRVDLGFESKIKGKI